MEADFQLAAFLTNTAAVTAIQAAKSADIPAAVMPTPRSIAASCGLSLRFSVENTESVQALLNEALETGFYKLYQPIETENGRLDYRLLFEN